MHLAGISREEKLSGNEIGTTVMLTKASRGTPSSRVVSDFKFIIVQIDTIFVAETENAKQVKFISGVLKLYAVPQLVSFFLF